MVIAQMADPANSQIQRLALREDMGGEGAVLPSSRVSQSSSSLSVCLQLAEASVLRTPPESLVA